MGPWWRRLFRNKKVERWAAWQKLLDERGLSWAYSEEDARRYPRLVDCPVYTGPTLSGLRDAGVILPVIDDHDVIVDFAIPSTRQVSADERHRLYRRIGQRLHPGEVTDGTE